MAKKDRLKLGKLVKRYRVEDGKGFGLKDFDPCTILLNNDLSSGTPGILEEIHEQAGGV